MKYNVHVHDLNEEADSWVYMSFLALINKKNFAHSPTQKCESEREWDKFGSEGIK